MSESKETVALQWAEFVTQVRYEDIPADVIHRMKRSLLDVLGVGVIGSRAPSSRILAAYFKQQGGTPESTIVPDGVRTTAVNAAMAFGSYVHATEFAESFTRATMHAGNAVPPAAIAVAEKQCASGGELLAAMAVGYEVAIRAGLACRVHADSDTFAAKDETRHELIPTYHPVSTFGTYGATAAAARLLGLSTEQTAQALTLCTSVTPAIGLTTSFLDGGMSKDLYQGFSNGWAVMAAELAGRGFTGARDVKAHFATLVPDYEAELLVRGLGSTYLISSGGLHFKLHQTSGMTQSAADAMLDAYSKHRDGPISPVDVEQVVVELNHRGTRPLMIDPDPTTDVAAKVSTPYIVSAIVAFYDTLEADPYFLDLYSDDKLADTERRALAQRVKIVGSDDFEHGFEQEWPMRFASRVAMHLRNGTVLEGESEIWSVSSNLSDEQVIHKFRHLTGRVLPKDHIDRAVDAVFSLDGDSTVDEVVRTLCL
jgi:2-methylcitrate dehydratase PrpD